MTSGATLAEITRWPAVIPLWASGAAPSAARAYGMSRNGAYDLCAREAFPVEVRRLGRLLRVATADVLADLGGPVGQGGASGEDEAAGLRPTAVRPLHVAPRI